MAGRILILMAVLLRFEFAAAAQTLGNLQVVVTNGTATVTSQNSPGGFIALLETATNLSPPVVWSAPANPTLANVVSSNFPAAGAQEFFRLLQTWPVFEFGVFYNLDLEINPYSVFGVGGSVWCNGNIYNSPSGRLVYFLPVYATGNVYYTRDPNDTSSSPAGNAANVIYSTAYMTNTGPIIHEFSLTLSVGNGGNTLSNANAILQLPPAAYAVSGAPAYTAAGQVYLYNSSDLIISNPATGGTPINRGTNITVYYENQNMTPPFTLVPGDVPIYTNIATHTTNYTYSFVTNATFYDYRENKTVNAIQIDVAAFNTWLTNSSARGGLVFDFENYSGSTSKNHHIWSIYAYNSVPMTGNTMPGVRVKNGQLLPPSGLTISTPDPLYVMGDYNIETNFNAPSSQQSRVVPDATYIRPAALMCDAITVLSTNYQDSWSFSTSLSSRVPITQHSGDTLMTFNAAILTGIVPSANGYYSGGLENYIRLLENWPTPDSICNTGSQVAMFASQFATNHYVSSGTYYNAPALDFGFDSNFLNFYQLPPLTPEVVNYVAP
jgi:hypothetical protein